MKVVRIIIKIINKYNNKNKIAKLTLYDIFSKKCIFKLNQLYLFI